MNTQNIKIGWRNIWKNKLFSSINLLGISIGLAATILILFWVVDEIKVDKFHENIEQIYTVYEHQQYSNGEELYTHCTPAPFSRYLKENFSEIEYATTIFRMYNLPIVLEDKRFKDGPFMFVDKDFLDIFSFDLLSGDKNAFDDPSNVFITQEVANYLYGNEPAIGKTFQIDQGDPFTVAGIIDSRKSESSLKFKILANNEILYQKWGIDRDTWNSNWPQTCVKLAAGTNTKDLNAKIKDIIIEYQDVTTAHLFPFKNEHLYNYNNKNNKVMYIYLFLAIAGIITLIASINFINFSTARSEQRRPEVGIRKTLGAKRSTIFNQFVYEKGMLILMSTLIAAIIIMALAPLFGQLAEKEITFSLLANKYLILSIIGVLLVTLLLSITYPALFVSGFSPALSLKKQTNKPNKLNFRNSLVVFQFTLSIVLIICSIAIGSQLRFLNNYDLGYNKENLIYLELDESQKQKHEILANEFKQLPGVTATTKADKAPFFGGNSSWGYNWEGKDPEKTVLICRMHVMPNYFETMDIEFAEGKSFSNYFDGVIGEDFDKRVEVILNQEAIRQMELENPVGKQFTLHGIDATIVGVTKNFHFQSLHSGVEPMVMVPMNQLPSTLILRLKPDNFTQTIANIKSTWSSIYPDSSCEIGFFDERLKQMYESEIRISGLFRYFTFVAIFIAAIGLFGLSLYTIERRRKEIGVRKVNGSRVIEILTLLNKSFVRWVIISFVLATPVAWFLMNKYLESFAQRTNLSWWIFALAGVLALGIAVLTVSWQSWRAATRNPVEALRYE